MVKAFESGAEHAQRWEGAQTIASGIRVPKSVGDFLILRAVRESGGRAISVEDAEISAALDACARQDGLLLCPEGAATLAAWRKAVADDLVAQNEEAVLFNCASGLKYPLPPAERRLAKEAEISFERL